MKSVGHQCTQKKYYLRLISILSGSSPTIVHQYLNALAVQQMLIQIMGLTNHKYVGGIKKIIMGRALPV